MKILPTFITRPLEDVHGYIESILTNEYQTPPRPHLKHLIEYEDRHYRAIFSPEYFILAEEQSEPSKSQWTNLKKKMKRHDDRVFIFKERGVAGCDGAADGTDCYYLDFGFYARMPDVRPIKRKK